MWRPPERIKYRPSVESWPTAEEARISLLYQPLEYQRLKVCQRTWVPAMVPWRSNPSGVVTRDVVNWYQRFAMGKPGAIVVEATGVRDIPSGPLLRISDDRYIEGLSKIVEAVKQASEGETRLFIQLIDFLAIRRRPQKMRFLSEFLTITEAHMKQLGSNDEVEVRRQLVAANDEQLKEILTAREFEDLSYGARERITDPHIRELPQQLPGLFVRAAQRAEEAGFDGVELHYAHAYTLSSFLSRANNREDSYGGSKENRLRLPLEVYHRVRASVGEKFVVGCRYLSDEIIDGGSRVEDAIYYGIEFAKSGMDFISVSRGGKFDDAKQPKVGRAAYPYTGRSGYECMPQYISDERGPFGRNISPTARIRAAIRESQIGTPVIVAGGIHGFEQAEMILQKGDADIIAFARQALADPDWFEKVRYGRGDAVQLCRYSNYCEALDQQHKQVTCELWDRLDLDQPGVTLSLDGKRRLIAPVVNTQPSRGCNEQENKS